SVTTCGAAPTGGSTFPGASCPPSSTAQARSVTPDGTPGPFETSGVPEHTVPQNPRSVRAPHLTSSRRAPDSSTPARRSEEHTSELQSRFDLVCRLLLEKKKRKTERTAD